MSAPQLIVCAMPDWLAIKILVPKRRGQGFLRTPYGHHHSPALSAIEDQIGYDLTGLDGSLDIETGSISLAGRDRLIETVLPPIAEHYGMSWRVVDANEFWSLHPFAGIRP